MAIILFKQDNEIDLNSNTTNHLVWTYDIDLLYHIIWTKAEAVGIKIWIGLPDSISNPLIALSYCPGPWQLCWTWRWSRRRACQVAITASSIASGSSLSLSRASLNERPQYVDSLCQIQWEESSRAPSEVSIIFWKDFTNHSSFIWYFLQLIP